MRNPLFNSNNRHEHLKTGIDVFHQDSSGLLIIDYKKVTSEEALCSSRLSVLAEQKSWSNNTDLNWSCISMEKFPYQENYNPLAGFKAYDQLTAAEQQRISWQLHGMEIGEILHGEQLAFMCASQLITLMPCLEGKLFASSQAADEARHISFFRKYLESMHLQVAEPSPCLKQLTIDALQHPDWTVKLLVCQILIESLALAQFNHLLTTSTQHQLIQGLRLIISDEARHVKFGTTYLKSLFSQLNAEQREHYGHYVIDKALGLASSDNHCTVISSIHNWSTSELRHHFRSRRIRNSALIQLRFRQLSLNIKAVGLMTETVRQRIQRFTGA